MDTIIEVVLKWTLIYVVYRIIVILLERISQRNFQRKRIDAQLDRFIERLEREQNG